MITRPHHGYRHPTGRGTVLLFALLVMSNVIIAAAGLSALVLSSLQQSRVIDNGIVAYYAAESAIEDGLYAFRRSGELPQSVPAETPQMLSNSAMWSRTVTNSEPVVYATIPRDATLEVALYDPDAEIAPTSIGQAEVQWADACGGCGSLTASLVSWTPGGPISWNPNSATYNFAASPATLSLPASPGLHKLRLRANGATLENVQIRAKTDAGAPVPIPGRVKIDARGVYASSGQRLSVAAPRQTPLAGIFDFVIFSECSLVKDGPFNCP